jgi:hypothetical protein
MVGDVGGLAFEMARDPAAGVVAFRHSRQRRVVQGVVADVRLLGE